MGLPDGPGSPLVFNYGYRGARPVAAWLHFRRVLDSGVKPAAVLIQLAPQEIMSSRTGEQTAEWTPRFTPGDIRRSPVSLVFAQSPHSSASSSYDRNRSAFPYIIVVIINSSAEVSAAICLSSPATRAGLPTS